MKHFSQTIGGNNYCWPALASAPLDAAHLLVTQNGMQVGEIYVPGGASRSQYVEHWVLYPNYVYPNARNQLQTEIVPSPLRRYFSEADFFSMVPWGPGFRYVHVTSNHTVLPGRDEAKSVLTFPSAGYQATK